MHHFEVPHEDWSLFTDGFSRLHSRWLLSIEVLDRYGRVHVVARRAPLREIAVVDDGISITVETDRRMVVTHVVERPVSMSLEKTEAGGHRGIRISGNNGITTILRFTPAVSVLGGEAAAGLDSKAQRYPH